VDKTKKGEGKRVSTVKGRGGATREGETANLVRKPEHQQPFTLGSSKEKGKNSEKGEGPT